MKNKVYNIFYYLKYTMLVDIDKLLITGEYLNYEDLVFCKIIPNIIITDEQRVRLLWHAFSLGDFEICNILAKDIDKNNFNSYLRGNQLYPEHHYFETILEFDDYDLMKLYLNIRQIEITGQEHMQERYRKYNKSMIAILEYSNNNNENQIKLQDVLFLFDHIFDHSLDLVKFVYKKYRHINTDLDTLDQPIRYDNNCDITKLLLTNICKNSDYKDSVKYVDYILKEYNQEIKFNLHTDFIFFTYESYNEALLSENFMDEEFGLELLLILAISNENYHLIDYLIKEHKVDINKCNKFKAPNKVLLYHLLTKGFTYEKMNSAKRLYLKQIYEKLYLWWLKLNYQAFDKHLLKTIITYL